MKIATTTGDFGRYCKNDIERIRQLHKAGFRYVDLDMYSFTPNCAYMQDDWKNAVRALKQEADRLGMQIDEDYPQLEYAKGYDYNYVVEGTLGTLRPVALAKSDFTGISMQVETTLPGVHFYTANYVPEECVGKGGCSYGPRHAFCLETQYYPDAIHHPVFPSPILKSGVQYVHETQFRFGMV